MPKPKQKLVDPDQPDEQASAPREPEPDGKPGEGADRDTQVDQREKPIPDDGMLGADVSR